MLDPLATSYDPGTRMQAAENRDLSRETALLLVNDQFGMVRRVLAENHAAPADVLAALARDPEDLVCGAVARNRATPVAVLAELITVDGNSRSWVRLGLASNPNTPADILTLLSTDDCDDPRRKSYYGHVAMRVAGNPSTPVDVLRRLSSDTDYFVRAAAAGNPRLPEDLFAVLAADRTKSVRDAVTKNPNRPSNVVVTKRTPFEVKMDAVLAARSEQDLAPYLADSSSRVSIPALFRAHELRALTLPQLKRELDLKNNIQAAVNDWMTRRLSVDPISDATVRIAILTRSDYLMAAAAQRQAPLTERQLCMLAGSRCMPLTSWRIARTYPMTATLLEALSTAPGHSSSRWQAKELEREKREAGVAVVPCKNYYMLEPSLVALTHPDMPETVLARFAGKGGKVRAAMLSRHDAAPTSLDKGASDKSVLVRRAVAGNPVTPAGTLLRLGLDPDRTVRAAVLANPGAPDEAKTAAALTA